MTTTTVERKATAVRLHIFVEVPTSASPGDVLKQLHRAAVRQQGVTIVMPEGNKVDVDLQLVQEVLG